MKVAKRAAALMGVVLLLAASCSSETRESGKVFEAEGFGQSLSAAFFDFQVDDAELAEEIEEYQPNDEEKQFLIVNVTVTNTFEDEDSIPMFDTDFRLLWEGQEEQGLYCEQNFASIQLPEEYTLEKGESRTGSLVFVVPRGITEFTLEYLEIYEDQFEGNTFNIHFSVQ